MGESWRRPLPTGKRTYRKHELGPAGPDFQSTSRQYLKVIPTLTTLIGAVKIYPDALSIIQQLNNTHVCLFRVRVSNYREQGRERDKGQFPLELNGGRLMIIYIFRFVSGRLRGGNHHCRGKSGKGTRENANSLARSFIRLSNKILRGLTSASQRSPAARALPFRVYGLFYVQNKVKTP
ncbi:hypothetical protein EVAR_27611_1 [Eumeta japonica]|uniref:Uncharacterized protein n=1 Tax=Eumeta variegata TaxID=151549 RepID=A0A4C1V0C2_EUMVA|nr:hypothetical protein EVAR_27611_1 [Eumeta japonica]